ncbi:MULTISPECIES: hypothetical protein [Pseudomonas]|uniref:hypothetical protein n=1 Tax=Pseudomonas TaxID=286 RepID=UPI0012E1BFB3|nr:MULTISPECIES: hypothetical protein [Pseudomonas]MDG9809512.1 hypothetical protein [Pseudomonas juntendi]MDG9815758.1 hypothetical protein [Pseudomonas putida]
MVFIYRAQHPSVVIVRSGLNPQNPEVLRQPVMRFAARVRLMVGALIMVLVVTGSYKLPIEIGQVITAAQERQSQLAQARLSYRLQAEKRHTDEMIEALGGADGYLAYLSAQKERAFLQK